MPQEPTSEPIHIIQGAAVIQVTDIAPTVRFYRDLLGFSCDFQDVKYAVVWRDNAAVHFRKGPTKSTEVELFFWVKDADILHAEFMSKGVPAGEVESQPYGIRDFSVTDPNGVKIVFGHDLE
ncbi:MAG: VOC family protein [Chthonomonas sp.]|nr:VOC family protein [Chthonomonas sp.]